MVSEGIKRYMFCISIPIFILTMVQCSKPGPDQIIIKKPNLFPEGVEYDRGQKRFLITSLREGIISEVKMDGTSQVFIDDDVLVSAIGIRVDSSRQRILVCNSDPGASVKTKPETQKKLAGLGIYDLKNGQKINYLNLHTLRPEGNHFANDIAIDGKGNAYVTDSFSPIIYKVTATGEFSIFLENSRFTGDGFNLNGIVFNRNNFLIVAKYNEGILFRVPIGNPDNFAEIKIDKKFPGADGLLWSVSGDLIVIANSSTNKVFQLRSTDGWKSASIASEMVTGEVFATTGVLRGHEAYVLYAQLHKLFGGQLPVEKFTIKKIKF